MPTDSFNTKKKPHSRQATASSISHTPHSWLLRLFQSEFFDIRLAILYLYKYPRIIGIQNYICNELKTFAEEEFVCILPQLWYRVFTVYRHAN